MRTELFPFTFNFLLVRLGNLFNIFISPLIASKKDKRGSKNLETCYKLRLIKNLFANVKSHLTKGRPPIERRYDYGQMCIRDQKVSTWEQNCILLPGAHFLIVRAEILNVKIIKKRKHYIEDLVSEIKKTRIKRQTYVSATYREDVSS